MNKFCKKLQSQKDFLGKVFLLIWIATVTLIISLQMGSHLFSLPKIKNSDFNIAQLISDLPPQKSKALHFILDSCTCTQSLLKNFVQRKAKTHLSEVIYYITLDSDINSSTPYEKDLLQAGYLVKRITKQSLSSMAPLRAAPVLVLLNEQNEILYNGGYFKTSNQRDPQDNIIISQAEQNNQPLESLPIFGCGLSKDIRKYLNPWESLFF